MSEAGLQTPLFDPSTFLVGSLAAAGLKIVGKGLAGLSEDIAATFAGNIRSFTLQSDVLAYRFSGGVSSPAGRFLTTRQTLSLIKSPEEAIRVLNLPAGATATQLNRFLIPAGTEVFMGRVAGGAADATQVFINNPGVLISVP